MKHLNETINVNTAARIDIFQYLWPMDESVLDDLVFDNSLKDRFGVILTKRELRMIVAFMKWCHSPICHIQTPEEALKYFNTITDKRKNSFIGAGSEGMVFEYKNYIIKVLFDIDSDPKAKDAYTRWANYKKPLITIPNIIRMGKGCSYIVLPKLITPVKEGHILEDIIDEIPEEQLAKDYSQDEIAWGNAWVKQFYKEASYILGRSVFGNDVRWVNIGKDPRTGNVQCFDWFASIYDINY